MTFATKTTCASVMPAQQTPAHGSGAMVLVRCACAYLPSCVVLALLTESVRTHHAEATHLHSVLWDF